MWTFIRCACKDILPAITWISIMKIQKKMAYIPCLEPVVSVGAKKKEFSSKISLLWPFHLQHKCMRQVDACWCHSPNYSLIPIINTLLIFVSAITLCHCRVRLIGIFWKIKKRVLLIGKRILLSIQARFSIHHTLW